MRLRSSSATAPKTVNTILPIGVLVSTCSESETSSMPRARKVSRARSRWDTERAKRSNFQTTTASKRRRWASVSIRSSSGRFSFVPEIPTSTYSPATCQPRRSQYSWSSRDRWTMCWGSQAAGNPFLSPVPIRILSTPKPPCPAMYFQPEGGKRVENRISHLRNTVPKDGSFICTTLWRPGPRDRTEFLYHGE